MTDFQLFVDYKSDSYDAILVIINQLTKIVHYQVVKTWIDVSVLAKVIINIVLRHYDLSKLIISDHNLLFTSKF